jgi:amino acid transporter
MARAHKFGPFGGVFVPSALTILGVIMYLRLGWVVGNAGLVGTVIIILIAHVISVTTGLSISSIATDKKVEAGGLYYILSRSLGLPIGGAIGIALFVATALSIAMYIVGFGESFNNAIGLSSPEMEVAERITNLRITGTVTLILVTSIALISTSLVIKTQYYILGAIALSLVSIFAGGLFLDHGYEVTSQSMFSGADSVPLATVFAIFFPAVTGFTAGVAMSGDLKDPKKAIPIGTMSAIGVGLVIYLGLAVFLSLNIDAQILREDTNILAKIALFSAYGAPFLLAGIWGATLSSALGGILGGPRILQAMSLDKVTPKMFGKGVGKSNEPRNALIFSFIIAEAGVLIGELDLIAPIVSMFYLTAYGFINLTSALESWSGSDFRPTFKVPKAVSLVGAIATFSVMFKLDMIAMIAAFVVIGMIFLYLAKKQINLGYSDIWQGVWSEVVRTGLDKMNKRATDKRSWRPNIILFSGGTDKRRYLLEYGTRLVGRLGLLSNFDLVEDPGTEVIFAKRDQVVDNPDGNKGIFTRQYSCQDIYSGIERIAETYGFSGIDPNTILMGWARYSKHPVRFSGLLRKLQQLDYSLLVMDYDKQEGFGKRQRIDIWWKGKGRHISFALTICRFLHTSDDWQSAAIRLYILADTSQVDDNVIYEIMDQAQEELRVNLDLRIINTALDQRSYYNLIQVESADADLIYVELPDLEHTKEQEFFKETDELCKEIGTVILYKASSEFDSIDLGLEKKVFDQKASLTSTEINLDTTTAFDVPELQLPSHPVLADNFKSLDLTVIRLIDNFYQIHLVPFENKDVQLAQSIQALILDTYDQLSVHLQTSKSDLFKYVTQQERKLLKEILQLITDFQAHELRQQGQQLATAIDHQSQQIEQVVSKSPRYLLLDYRKEDLSSEQFRNLSWKHRIKSNFTSRNFHHRLYFQRIAVFLLRQQYRKALLEIQNQINQDSDQIGSELRKYIRRTAAGLQNLKNSPPNQIVEALENEREQIGTRFENLISLIRAQLGAYRDYMLTHNRIQLEQLREAVDEVNGNRFVKSQLHSQKQLELLNTEFNHAIDAWNYNQPLFFNMNRLEVGLIMVQNDLWQQVIQLKSDLRKIIKKKTLDKVDQLIQSLKNLREQIVSGKKISQPLEHHTTEFEVLTESVRDFIANVKEIGNKLPNKIVAPDTSDAALNLSEEIDTIEIVPRDVVGYFIQKNIVESLEANTAELHPMLSQVDHTMVDVLQVVTLTLEGTGDEIDNQEEMNSSKIVKVIDEEISRLLDAKDRLEQAVTAELEGLIKAYGTVSENLNARSLIRFALDFDYYLRTQKQTQVINKFGNYTKRVKDKITSGLTKIYYSKSEGLIAARRFQKYEKDTGVRSELISKLVNEITPNQNVLESLPFYYRQLFLRPHSVGKDLWLIRSQESSLVEESIAHYTKVKSGGLMVLGAPRSGKTFLSELIAKSHFAKERIFNVTPPDEGSTRLEVFERSIKKSLRYYGALESAFDHLEPDSVLLFNDAELWWERSENGFEVLDNLMELIDRYSHKCLFIVNMSSYSYQLINKISRIEDAFFKVIKTSPFNAAELKDVILARHGTSRLKFEIDGRSEDELSKWNQAKLFTNYFDTAGGSVGVALQQWISNINSISDQGVIQMHYPKQSKDEILHSLDKDQVILLIQFILHKRLSAVRLLNIMKLTKEDLDKRLEVLNRLDILRERNGIWEVNRYLQPLLIEALEEDMLI